MEDFINNLLYVVSNSTVKTTAAVLAVGGFLANTLFGFGQTTLGLGIQVIGAAATLGVVAANVCQNNFEQTYSDQPENIISCGPTNTLFDNIISCGPTFLPSLPTRTKRRNADDDTMDIAYGKGTRAGWKSWT